MSRTRRDEGGQCSPGSEQVAERDVLAWRVADGNIAGAEIDPWNAQLAEDRQLGTVRRSSQICLCTEAPGAGLKVLDGRQVRVDLVRLSPDRMVAAGHIADLGMDTALDGRSREQLLEVDADFVEPFAGEEGPDK